jgi:pimeloyl-ACP methyl ester carboxylesterase
VTLRYNTGLPIAENGRRLSALLEDLAENWPVAIEHLALVGHSMGGLVIRSAAHVAAEHGYRWPELVDTTIALGTPHMGAPLEQAVHFAAHALSVFPESRPVGAVIDTRSVGIKDLRRGTLVEADWTDRDLDALTPGNHTHVPLLDGARHFVVLATLSRNPSGRVADLLGDLLVPPRSATGDTGEDDRLAFPPDHVHRLGGLHHFDLLNHPRVYEAMRSWLQHGQPSPAP